MTRKPLSKKLRFEVFKRDKFACQYCGAAAPDVLLHVDHIDPVKRGGKERHHEPDHRLLGLQRQNACGYKYDRDNAIITRLRELKQAGYQVRDIESWAKTTTHATHFWEWTQAWLDRAEAMRKERPS